jgi:hypothetical protein
VNRIGRVGFNVLTAASMKMTAFWYIAQCSLVEYTDVSELHIASHHHRPDNGGSTHL